MAIGSFQFDFQVLGGLHQKGGVLKRFLVIGFEDLLFLHFSAWETNILGFFVRATVWLLAGRRGQGKYQEEGDKAAHGWCPYHSAVLENCTVRISRGTRHGGAHGSTAAGRQLT